MQESLGCAKKSGGKLTKATAVECQRQKQIALAAGKTPRDKPANICGIVNVYDVLTDADAKPIRDHIDDALYLRPHDTVPAALLTLQQARRAMAVVRDRKVQCIGILTVKDLVEEVVGELEVW